MAGERLAVVAAHPDDEVLLAGGLIARCAAAGGEARILILGEGATSRARTRAAGDPAAVALLRQQAQQAGQQLGAREVRQHDLADNRFDGVELLDIVKLIEDALAAWQPDTVITHHGGDLNLDHRLTLQAVLAATRPKAGQSVHTVLAGEVPSASDWSFGAVAGPFVPNWFADISGTLDAKLAALAVYDGEGAHFPHPRSRQAVAALAQVRGAAAGVAAAEAFMVIRTVR